MTYTQFTTGNVPGVKEPNDPTKGMPILKIGDSKNSNIILALSGSGPIFGPPGPPPTIGPMPPFPPPALPDPQIKALADWIDAKCPEFPTPPTPAAPKQGLMTLNSFKDVQDMLTDFVTSQGSRSPRRPTSTFGPS